MSTILDKLRRLRFTREDLVSRGYTASEEVEALQKQVADHSTAQELLDALLLHRKRQAAARLARTVTGGLQQVFDFDISATLGSGDSVSNGKLVNVLVTTDGVTQDVRRGCGRSVRAVTDFCVWLDLFCALRGQYNLRPFVTFDEPFLALHPDRYERVQALLQGLVDIGVQVVVCTNQTGMIPEGATVVRLGEKAR